MRKKMHKAFLLVALLCLSLGTVGAAVLDSWIDGQTITSARNVWSGDDSDSLSLDGTLTISGAVYVGAHNHDLTVNVTSDDVWVKPYNQNATASGYEYGHLIFYAADGQEITVNCQYDLIFTGSYNVSLSNYKNVDMILTFSGQGVTRFKLHDKNPESDWSGAQVHFTGKGIGSMGELISQAGTRVQILMDQTETQAVTNGVNKVVFQRESWNGTNTGTQESPVYPYQGFPTGVEVGPASYVTYLSPNATGLSTDEYSEGDFGALAFDPTHAGTGRMFLKVAGDQNNPYQYNFHDGGIIVCGHFVPSFSSESDLRSLVYLNATAGQKAIFRIIDTLRYTGNQDTDPTVDERRGLLLINENKTVAKLAIDPYGDIEFAGLDTPNDSSHPNYSNGYWACDYAWYYAPNNHYAPNANFNVRTGFVMGVNGHMDVYHQTFLDYVAAYYGELDWFAAEDAADYYTGDYTSYDSNSPLFQWRNPSAFVVDGLNEYSNYNDDLEDGTVYLGDTNAEMRLYGDARAYFRCGANSSGVSDGFPSFNDQYELVYTYTIGTGTYNGRYVANSNYSAGAGEGVLDVEGRFVVRSLERNDAPGRDGYEDADDPDAGQDPEMGMINVPSVAIDHTGREYTNFNGTDRGNVERPLIKDSQTYAVYNSAHIFLNGRMDVYNTLINHNDVTKDVLVDPYWARPAIIGGERLYFNTTVWGDYTGDAYLFEHYEYPKIFMHNSYLDMHESLACSGMRWVVREVKKDKDGTYVYGENANNTSVFRFYDHGDALDTLIKGYGRLFMLGSGYNLMSDLSTNYVVESAFVNVYRNRKIPTAVEEDPADTIKLSIRTSNDGDVSSLEKAQHLFMMSRGDAAAPSKTATYGKAYMSLGWTFTVGDGYYFPWEGALSSATVNEIDLAEDGYDKHAQLSIDGDLIYFGGTDQNLVNAKVPVTSSTQGSVLYVNHGGRISVTQPPEDGDFVEGDPDWYAHGYDAYFDLPIATRLWNEAVLSGVIDIPKDQAIFGEGFGVYPYDVNTALAEGPLRLNVYNSSDIVETGRFSIKDRKAGEEVAVAWSHRAYDEDFAPVKSILARKPKTRFTAALTAPVTPPDNYLYIEYPDAITQLKVGGATMADPMHLWVKGQEDAPGIARIREIVSVASDPVVHGEGAHAAIFLSYGGRIGLGSRDWNADSDNAWSLLGKDYVTICPDGNGVVDVNSDLIFADPAGILPTENFGSELIGESDPRLTFFAQDTHEIRIPAYGELDLSAFGKGDGGDPSTTVRQQIEFGGKVRLVFEPGSTIRFPSIDNRDAKYPVIYMNDEAEIIFEGTQDRSKGGYSDIDESNAEKIRIKGCGQIWLNKYAKLKVMGDARVAVQSDEATPITDLIISIQRQGAFYIGDNNVAGGAFEIGNPEEVDDSRIDFALTLNGPKAMFHIDREGFFGIGAGILNKDGSPNGDATSDDNPTIDEDAGTITWNPDEDNAWSVVRLYNAHMIHFNVQEGIFDHSNIFNGSDRQASLIAFGPVADAEYDGEDEEGAYRWTVASPTHSKVLGGGNIMWLSEDAETVYANIWNYASIDEDGLPTSQIDEDEEETGDAYSILASAPVMLQQNADNFSDSEVEVLDGGGVEFIGTQPEFFKFVAYPIYANLPGKYVCVGATQFLGYLGYVNSSDTFATGVEIYRDNRVNIVGEGTIEEALADGVLAASGTEAPVNYTLAK